MISLIIWIVLLIVLITLTIYQQDDEYLAGIFLVFIFGIVMFSAMFFKYKIQATEKIKMYESTIWQYLNLIDNNKVLNMVDADVNRQLAETIKEYEEYKMDLRCAKKNPFVLFKPEVSEKETK